MRNNSKTGKKGLGRGEGDEWKADKRGRRVPLGLNANDPSTVCAGSAAVIHRPWSGTVAVPRRHSSLVNK